MMALFGGFALACEATGGCAKHVDEPAPPPPATADDSTPARRCMHATPDKPERVLHAAVPDPRCPDDPDVPPRLSLGALHFPEAKNGDAGVPELAVEIAVKQEDRNRGLMYRKGMGADSGMLFVFDREDAREFWMKNTCIPLDMLFIAGDGTIVDIQENVPTIDTSPTYPSECPAQYVVETNAGWTRKHGVKAGQKVTLPPL